MACSANTTNCNVSIDCFRKNVYPMAYSIISIVGFIGNGFVLCVLIRTYQAKTSFQIFMLNLAISDLLFVCTLPLRVAYYLNEGNWLFGDLLCRISSYAMYVNLYCSILFMAAMSFFRCIAIVFPMQNLHYITEKKAIMVCCTIWISVTLMATPFLLGGSYRDTETNKTKCLEPPQPDQMLKVAILHYIALFIGFIFPLIVIAICYTMIIRTLMKNSPYKKRSARKKAIWMIVIVTLTFLFSFTPYHIQRTVHIHVVLRRGSDCEKIIFVQKMVIITLSLAACNCCFDPLLYFFSGGNFLRRLSTLINESAVPSLPELHRNKISLKNLEDNPIEEKVPKSSGTVALLFCRSCHSSDEAESRKAINI
uniref:Cysteinyl leukotriene receptor 1 n=1 Tax=Salvator merianae TaxID=96440 RepID=A0A8D0DNY9_SALMN